MIKPHSRFYTRFLQLRLGFIVLVPILLLFFPADFFDRGKSVCLSVMLFNKTCHACGLTRGIMHLVHGEFETAFAYNMGSFIVLPLLAFLWIKWGVDTYKILRVRLQAQPTQLPD